MTMSQHDVRAFLDDLLLELVTVEVRHDVVTGRAQDRLHHLELGIGVVDHHHLGHRQTISSRARHGAFLSPPC